MKSWSKLVIKRSNKNLIKILSSSLSSLMEGLRHSSAELWKPIEIEKEGRQNLKFHEKERPCWKFEEEQFLVEWNRTLAGASFPLHPQLTKSISTFLLSWFSENYSFLLAAASMTSTAKFSRIIQLHRNFEQKKS